MASGDKGLYFFKVFDLSFFAPGMVLALTGAWIWNHHLGSLQQKFTTPGGVLALMAAIGVIYILGLVCFSLTWALYRRVKKHETEGLKVLSDTYWPPLPLLFEGQQRDELILYFWYMRATCLTLATSFCISWLSIMATLAYQYHLLDVLHISLENLIAISLVELISFYFLIKQGLRFGKSVDRSLLHRAMDHDYFDPKDLCT